MSQVLGVLLYLETKDDYLKLIKLSSTKSYIILHDMTFQDFYAFKKCMYMYKISSTFMYTEAQAEHNYMYKPRAKLDSKFREK